MKTFVSAKSKNTSFAELWAFQDLIFALAKREFSVRYAQTFLGLMWVVIQPSLYIGIFSFIFGRVAKFQEQVPVPYLLVVISGVLPWTTFANSLSGVSQSMISDENLIKKVYFPRLVLPLSSCLVFGVDFLVTLFLSAGIMLCLGYQPPWTLALVPLLFPLLVFSALSLGLGIAAWNVKYRDFRYALPFLLQVLIFVTPVGFPISVTPEQYHWLFYLNPMSGIVELFRWLMLGKKFHPNLLLVLCSLVTLLACWFFSLSIFRKMEDRFADMI